MDMNAFDTAHAVPSSTLSREPASEATSVFTIGDLAREFDVTLRALRFYEDKGLLSPRREGLTRLYSAGDRTRLSLILKGKKLGFTLAEIKSMVALREGGPIPTGGLALTREKCVEQVGLLKRQKAEIEEAIVELQHMVDAFPSRTAA